VKIKSHYYVWFFLTSWVILWIFFQTRPYTILKKGKESQSLLKASTQLDRKRIIAGETFMDFIEFCQQRLPSKSRYRVVGLDWTKIEYRWLQYYLYPHFDTDPHDYLLVYNMSSYSRKGYSLFARINSDYFILKRDTL